MILLLTIAGSVVGGALLFFLISRLIKKLYPKKYRGTTSFLKSLLCCEYLSRNQSTSRHKETSIKKVGGRRRGQKGAGGDDGAADMEGGNGSDLLTSIITSDDGRTSETSAAYF